MIEEELLSFHYLHRHAFPKSERGVQHNLISFSNPFPYFHLFLSRFTQLDRNLEQYRVSHQEQGLFRILLFKIRFTVVCHQGRFRNQDRLSFLTGSDCDTDKKAGDQGSFGVLKKDTNLG